MWCNSWGVASLEYMRLQCLWLNDALFHLYRDVCRVRTCQATTNSIKLIYIVCPLKRNTNLQTTDMYHDMDWLLAISFYLKKTAMWCEYKKDKLNIYIVSWHLHTILRTCAMLFVELSFIFLNEMNWNEQTIQSKYIKNV